MPTLQELKAKWFIDVTLSGQFPPQTRHPGTQLQPYTDGNLVEFILDGAPLMAEFMQRAEAIINAPDPSRHELWLAQWKLQPVKLLGETESAPDAETEILRLAQAGAKVYFLGSAHVGQDQATRAFAKRLIAAGGMGSSDRRMPLYGSQHQKYYIFRGPDNRWLALLGSADLNYSRWDRPGHPAEEPDRSPLSDGPSHDVVLRLVGPAVHDIALTFAERWNDPAVNLHPRLTSPIDTSFVQNPIPPAGPHSVQVLRTYGQDKKRSYTWADQGEFTVWAAYLNAIKRAQQYIYIEDQYFYPFQEPGAEKTGARWRRDSDLVYQLGEALKRGVDVVVLVPSRKGNRNPTNSYQLFARKQAAEALWRLSHSFPKAGRFVASHLVAEKIDPVVHAKVMIVDDELALVGSANVCRRSMTHDTEIHVAIVDAENQFARDLRLALWQEHLDQADPESLRDPGKGITKLRDHAAGRRGRLRLFDRATGFRPPFYKAAMRTFIDPYGGPKGRDSS